MAHGIWTSFFFADLPSDDAVLLDAGSIDGGFGSLGNDTELGIPCRDTKNRERWGLYVGMPSRKQP